MTEIRYKLTSERIAVGRPLTPPKLGTFTPPAPYRVDGLRRPKGANPTGLSKKFEG